VWGLGSGSQLWSKKPTGSKRGSVCDVSFAHNGKSLIVCDFEGSVSIYETLTGSQLGNVRLPKQHGPAMSAALSPDGSKGVLITLGEQLFAFDTITGTASDTGLKGERLVRYSSHGKYIAMRAYESGSGTFLRIVTMDAHLAETNLGPFSEIGQIRPTEDGG